MSVNGFLIIFMLISIAVAGMDLVLAWLAWGHQEPTGHWLGWTGFIAALVDVFYFLSVSTESYMVNSVFSSLYFLSIDAMLIFFLRFTVSFVRKKRDKLRKWGFRIAQGLFLVECAIYAVNPFHEIAVSYARKPGPVVAYAYVMKPLYQFHLIYTYIMVIIVAVLLCYKMASVPREYRGQYRYGLWGLILIVGMNAVYLYVVGDTLLDRLDVSVWAYGFGLIMLYQGCFIYPKHGMLVHFRTSIFRNIDQGLVLFDVDDRLLMKNEKAEALLDGAVLPDGMDMTDFIQLCGIRTDINLNVDRYSVQCYTSQQKDSLPLRCDYRRIKNDEDRLIGRLFVLTDARSETDLLTGFMRWEQFQRIGQENPESFDYPVGVAMVDLIGLSMTNVSLGREEGDRLIRQLAAEMRSCFPPTCYFVRGQEAELIAMFCQTRERELSPYMRKLEENTSAPIQYAVSAATVSRPDILAAVHEAEKSLQNKKLMNRNSSRSILLTSLMRALQQCDEDTEAHVRRTQKMGEELGKRINLTDKQQSELSLLCMLHDIGKIGIPIEILNKPGKLSELEWKTLQSHVEKGYQITASAPELSGIAEMVRHHHERWDGTGYPSGLSRESIPLLSRIIAVIDAYDAMVNHRSYRRALSVAHAQEELRRCAGTQFDPSIVAEFLELLKKKPELAEGAEDASEDNNVRKPDSADLFKAGDIRPGNVHGVKYSRYLLDDHMNIIQTDAMFTELTGYSMDDLQKQPMKQIDLLPPEDRTDYLGKITAQLGANGAAFFEHRLRRKDGFITYVICYGKEYYDSAARGNRSEIIIADSSGTYAARTMADSQHNRAQAQLVQWENTYRKDSLTGLLHHAPFQNDVEARLLAGREKVLFLMMDVDWFKQYNDTYGHNAGDEYLALVGRSIASAMRKDDLACRMGGDEFAAAIFFGADESNSAMEDRANQIFDKINLMISASGMAHTGLSVGTAISEPGETRFRDLYTAADKALYRSKKEGRGKISFRDENVPALSAPGNDDPTGEHTGQTVSGQTEKR